MDTRVEAMALLNRELDRVKRHILKEEHRILVTRTPQPRPTTPMP